MRYMEPKTFSSILKYSILAPVARHVANRLLGRARELLASGDIDGAILSYSSAIELLELGVPDWYKDDHEEYRVNLSTIYARRGDVYRGSDYDIERAIEDYSKAIEILENKILYKEGIIKKLDFIRRIREIGKRPSLFTFYTLREVFSIALFLASLYTSRGRAYINKGEFREAIKDFSAAIEILDGLVLGRGYRSLKVWQIMIEAYIERGRAYDYAGDIYKAVENYSKVIEIIESEFPEKVKEKNISLLEYLILAYTAKESYYIYEGKIPEALEEYSAINLADKLRKRASKKSIIRILEERILGRKSPEIRKYIILSYIEGGKLYRAVGDIDKALEMHNSVIDIIENKLLKELEEEFLILIKYLILAYNERGKDYEYKGDIDKAIDDYLKAIEILELSIEDLLRLKDVEVPYLVLLSYYNLANAYREMGSPKVRDVLNRLKELMGSMKLLTSKELDVLLSIFYDLSFTYSLNKALELILKLHFSLKRLDIAMKFREASRKLMDLYLG